MKKFLYVFSSFLFVSVIVAIADTAQYTFGYDADGNMTSRSIVSLKTSTAQSGKQQIEEPIYRQALAEDLIVTIRPNPTQGQVAVDIFPIDLEVENTFLLYNSSGQLIESRAIDTGTVYIEITGNPGVYLLDLHLGGQTSQWKIIKQ